MVRSKMSAIHMPRFTVDTHLFSELGALLVGRNSTALNELVKNAYDADASTVIVHGEGLSSDEGSIIVVDDGIGMTAEAFQDGFLRIASQLKSEGERKSPVFNRRYTGKKGIGRLAAHKLASQISVQSTPAPQVYGPDHMGLRALIDWNVIEELDSLDDTGRGIQVETVPSGIGKPGTTIELRRLRQRWSHSMLTTFVGEVQSFEAPNFLVGEIPKSVIARPLLFDRPHIRDSSLDDLGFTVRLSGDFDVGEAYWRELAERSQWVIEILAKRGSTSVEYAIGPTIAETNRTPSARAEHWRYPHPDPEVGPFFSARIFVRATRRVPRPQQAFARGAAGIRLYMEGFRVLPYGERGDDWLRIDADYTHRREPFELDGLQGQSLDEPVERETFSRLANSSYYGAVFLTDADSPILQMLINREGFVPDEHFTNLKDLLRRGVDLSVRLRASVQTQKASASRPLEASASTRPGNVDQVLETAKDSLRRIRAQADRGGVVAAGLEHDLGQVSDAVGVAQKVVSEARSDQDVLRVAASVGTQLSAFVHEMNILLGQARSVDAVAERLALGEPIPRSSRRTLGDLRAGINSLIAQLERQVSFLTDIVSVSARRRRRRLPVRDQIETGLKMLSSRSERRNQTIEFDVPPNLRTPPMFSSEVLSILVNVLSNAIKAAGDGGYILIRATRADASIILEVSNTGEAVDLEDAERWFRPFESTTADIDEVLGQGMGLGLPIVRRLVEEYGGAARFTPSQAPFSTTIQIQIPDQTR